MINWSDLQVGVWWPLLLFALGLLLIVAQRLRKSEALFPDLRQLSDTAPFTALTDSLPVLLGGVIASLLVLALMDISASRQFETGKRARDFLVVVDVSRSMRQNTILRREDFPTTYERQANLFAGNVADPSAIPELARYEVARESLLQFLSERRDEDRVGLIYFNSNVHLMSGFTSNFNFIEKQLAAMDSHVSYGTNIRWALEHGLDLIERYPTRNRRALILLTDAEARDTEYLQRLDRLSKLDVAFYMLWITNDAGDSQSTMASRFLQAARAIGSVYIIDSLGEGFLDEALADIANLEDYPYMELRHERVSLSNAFFVAAQWLTLVWALLIGTLYLPLARVGWADSGRHE